MATLLFPGRHLVNTRFQEEYLHQVLCMPLERLAFQDEQPPDFDEPLDRVVFAITSANQQNSRFNPVPFHIRAMGVDRFARSLQQALGVRWRIIGIPHFGHTPRFASNTLKEIREQTEGELHLTPQDTVVLCSTPEVIGLYRELGFAILPAELGQPETERPPGPIDVVAAIAHSKEEWTHSQELRFHVSPATFSLWTDLPEVPRRVIRLYQDPLLTEEGDLTETRNYLSYAAGMSSPAIIELKYQDIVGAIVPGRITDEGCGDGGLLVPIAQDFPDSDLLGIEITDDFLALCRERQRRGDFGGTYVHFHQRNLLHPIFEPGSIDTTICNSTLHELWSYGQGEATVREYLGRKFAQATVGGRLIIRDVVGPEDGDQSVLLWCDDTDGVAGDPTEDFDTAAELEAWLNRFSTASRFRRFARDFLPSADGPPRGVAYEEVEVDGRPCFQLRLRDACEFLSRKDYTDNWKSEMHEEFTFWSFSQWKQALSQAGFTVLEDQAHPGRGSRAYTNAWIVEHRYVGRVALYRRTPSGDVQEMAWPPTNLVLVGEKRIQA